MIKANASRNPIITLLLLVVPILLVAIAATVGFVAQARFSPVGESSAPHGFSVQPLIVAMPQESANPMAIDP